MADYKLKKFNKNVYPYVNVTVYDYSKNEDVNMNVSTKELETELTNALLSDNTDLIKSAKEFDPTFMCFIEKDKILKWKTEDIIKYVSKQL